MAQTVFGTKMIKQRRLPKCWSKPQCPIHRPLKYKSPTTNNNNKHSTVFFLFLTSAAWKKIVFLQPGTQKAASLTAPERWPTNQKGKNLSGNYITDIPLEPKQQICVFTIRITGEEDWVFFAYFSVQVVFLQKILNIRCSWLPKRRMCAAVVGLLAVFVVVGFVSIVFFSLLFLHNDLKRANQV